jgi:histidinol-phosphate aminotransferase
LSAPARPYVNALAQAAGLAALEDDEHVARSRAHASACRELFARELRALGLNPIPSATNFIAVNVGDDLEVTSALMDQGFTVNPLGGWGLPGHIRISFGTDAENQRFFEALRNVLRP